MYKTGDKVIYSPTGSLGHILDATNRTRTLSRVPLVTCPELEYRIKSIDGQLVNIWASQVEALNCRHVLEDKQIGWIFKKIRKYCKHCNLSDSYIHRILREGTPDTLGFV